MTSPSETHDGVLEILEHALATARHVVDDAPWHADGDPLAADLTYLLGATERALARYQQLRRPLQRDFDF